VLEDLDHSYLNDVIHTNPTSEKLTIYIYKKIKDNFAHLEFKVRVYENAVGNIKYCESGDF